MEVVLDKVVKRYGQVTAVQCLDLTIRKSALHFFLGPSGCGKTTTLRMLAGLEAPSSGRILFDGKDVTNMPAAERGIGMVFQSYALWPHMTVRKNIEYGLNLRKLTRDEIKRRVSEVVSFTHLDNLEERLPGQLSGGQQQRVALARALAIRPNVLLLDEPLSNLDAQLRLEMRDNISRIHRETGITTVYVTHDQKEALSMGTSVSVMRKGELIQTDHPRHLYNHPATGFIAGFIGETNMMIGKLEEKNGDQATVSVGFGKMKVRCPFPLKVGDQVHVSLRPEAITLEFDKSDRGSRENILSGHLSHLNYLGESEQFFVKMSDGSDVKCTVFHSPEHALKAGDAVQLSVAARDVLALPFDEFVTKHH